MEELLRKLPKESPIHKLNLEQLLEIFEEEHEVIILYLWMQENGETISIEEAKEYLREVEQEGYTETRDYILVYKGTELKNYTKEKLLELIEDTYYVDRFFDKEQLAEMWLEETSKENAVKELMMVTDPHIELLGLEFHEVCNCESGEILMIAYKEF